MILPSAPAHTSATATIYPTGTSAALTSRAGEHELAAELHPEGHAVVLDKAKMKPGENLYILSEVEIRLHPEFHQLVEHNHRRRSDNGHCGEAFRGNIVHLRFIFSLTHSVA